MNHDFFRDVFCIFCFQVSFSFFWTLHNHGLAPLAQIELLLTNKSWRIHFVNNKYILVVVVVVVVATVVVVVIVIVVVYPANQRFNNV